MVSGETSSEEMLELRQVLDETTVRLAIEKITQEEYLRLEENIRQMRRALVQGDPQRAQELDIQFHMSID